MKKMILFFAITILALTGCVDYGCETYFRVSNQTEENVVVELGQDGVAYRSTTIQVGDEQPIYDLSGLCGKDDVGQDRYSQDAYMLLSIYMTVNEETMSDEIWIRKYWKFVSKNNTATYVLTITDKLLDDMRQ